MSYSILYRRIFLRLPDGTFIGMVESGDNNVWHLDDSLRMMRSRSWCAWRFGDSKLSYTEEEIGRHLDILKKDCDGLTIYGRSNASVSPKSIRNFFQTGLRNAVPFNVFAAASGGISLSWYEPQPDGAPIFTKSPAYLFPGHLRDAYDELKKRLGGAPWIIASSPDAFGQAADVIASRSKKGCTVRLTYTEKDGTEKQSYVRSFIPLTLTDDAGETARFRLGIIKSRPQFELLEKVAPDIDVTHIQYKEQ